MGGQEWGRVVNDRNQSRYSNMKVSYKNKGLIYESTGIALVRGNGGAIDAGLGINRCEWNTIKAKYI